jgi:hypothetical protein
MGRELGARLGRVSDVGQWQPCAAATVRPLLGEDPDLGLVSSAEDLGAIFADSEDGTAGPAASISYRDG